MKILKNLKILIVHIFRFKHLIKADPLRNADNPSLAPLPPRPPPSYRSPARHTASDSLLLTPVPACTLFHSPPCRLSPCRVACRLTPPSPRSSSALNSSIPVIISSPVWRPSSLRYGSHNDAIVARRTYAGGRVRLQFHHHHQLDPAAGVLIPTTTLHHLPSTSPAPIRPTTAPVQPRRCQATSQWPQLRPHHCGFWHMAAARLYVRAQPTLLPAHLILLLASLPRALPDGHLCERGCFVPTLPSPPPSSPYKVSVWRCSV
jgi:hypothetical protein